ncbi:MAG: hypothetical protein JSV80_13665 [Acidobacteriota bacterium]|nr:MAG: hypothetical protein JSV80_13665 [Acidobacteriota bacterium]
MSLWLNMDERARRLGILDTKLAQGAAIFFALVIVKLFPQIMTLSIWWFVGLTVICAIKPVMTFFGEGGQQPRASSRISPQ